ncbi:GNAT family N-acetyltransferase [Streptomyces sp. NBC_00414]|uniref:GNAT family N-acetyltransferase n=1 Tax=Streptomyces sp. NBC_00414 TaxID=2975739 RepID=UPI003FA7B039
MLVHPAHRTRGIARTVISVAVEHARAAGAETMVLLCSPDLVPLYAQLGWSRLSVPVTFRQPDGERTSPLTTMIYDLACLIPPLMWICATCLSEALNRVAPCGQAASAETRLTGHQEPELP